MLWYVLIGCFVIGWVKQTARREASRTGRYYSPPPAPPAPKAASGRKPRKVIQP